MQESLEFKRQQRRSRLVLLLIAFLFLGSFCVAAVLRFSGWVPSGTKNFGELINPPQDFSHVAFVKTDGTAYAWQPQKNRWRIAYVSNHACEAICAQQYDALRRLWVSEGRHAADIDVLWFAEMPANALHYPAIQAMQKNAAWNALSLATHEVYLIDPSGFVMMRYPLGFNLAGMRKDLSKLVK